MEVIEQPRSEPLASGLCVTQGIFYVATGVWPIVHLRSFEAVTGPKLEGWLVKTVGALIAVVGGIAITVASAAAYAIENSSWIGGGTLLLRLKTRGSPAEVATGEFTSDLSVSSSFVVLPIPKVNFPAPNTVTGTSAACNTAFSRCAWAETSGWPATCKIRNGGIPFPFATCVTAEKSRCFCGSLPNFWRCPIVGSGRRWTVCRSSAVAMIAGRS